MRTRFDGFVGPTYQVVPSNVAMDRAINLYPEFDQSGTSKSKIRFQSTPGLSSYITIPSSPVRALWAGNDRVFVVAGGDYGEIIGTSVTFQDRGAILNSSDPAQILSNGTQLLIVASGNLYYDLGGAATGSNAVLVGTFPAIYGTYLDGYFLAVDPVANHIRYSGLFDGTTWNALDFFARASSRDALVAGVAHGGQLWLIGKRFINVWFNSGNPVNPFQPIQGSGIAQGVLSAHTIAELDGSLFFASEDDRGYCGVFRTRGFQLERVSTQAIDEQLTAVAAGQFVGYAYEENGHRFYVMTNYGGSQTFIYDTTTKMWHERGFWNGTAFIAQLGRCHCYTTPGFSGATSARKHLVGANNSGIVYEQSVNFFTDGGSAIRRYRQAPHVHNENKKLFHHSIELELNSGSFSGAAEALVKWSDDDGSSFAADHPVSLGNAGEFNKRVILRRLGNSRDRIYGVTFHNVLGRLGINDAFLDVTPGNS